MWILPNSLKCSLIKQPSQSLDFSRIAHKSLLVRSKVLSENAWVTKCKRDPFCALIYKKYFGALTLNLKIQSALHKAMKKETDRFIKFEEHHWKTWLISQKKKKADPHFNKWATPVVGDAHLALTKPLAPYSDGAPRINTFLRQVCHESRYQGHLNPRWVECLMGIPIGWVSAFSQIKYIRIINQIKKNTWPTPLASQRGDDLLIYLRRSHKRFKKGESPFAILLTQAVEAEHLGICMNNIWTDSARQEDTEVFIKRIITQTK